MSLRATALVLTAALTSPAVAAPPRGKGPAGSAVKVSRLRVDALLPSGQLFNSGIGENSDVTSAAPLAVQFELAQGKKPEAIRELVIRVKAAPDTEGSPGELDRVTVQDVQPGSYLFTFKPKERWPNDFCQGVLVEVSGTTDKGTFKAAADKLSIGWCAE